VFYRRGDPVERVYFLTGGVASILTSMANGGVVEAASIGDEGMLGFEAFLGEGVTAENDVIMQVPAPTAEMLSAAAFRREAARGTALRELLNRYALALLCQVRQSAACNALHSIHDRCCCWLLQTLDRVHADRFFLSQEFLAVMLGVRRQSITAVARGLQETGAIAYKHGFMRVLDRAQLEACSCECYGVVRAQFDRLRL
jgi:CRP-like cAMP-binding protein